MRTDWNVQDAQHAVNTVASMMAGRDRSLVEEHLRLWLKSRNATLPEPQFSWVVGEIADGRTVVIVRT